LNSLSYSNYPNISKRRRREEKNILVFAFFKLIFVHSELVFWLSLSPLTDLITHSEASVRAAFISTKPSSWHENEMWNGF
jgi:hypothetical protein